MPRCLQLLIFASCLACLPELSWANNSYFIPGDAFFYFEIDQAEWKAFKAGKQSIWKYDRPEHLSFTFCGYAGYENLDLGDLPDDFRKRFIESVDTMKKSFPTKIEEREVPNGFAPGLIEKEQFELNKIRIFVFNKDFDFSRHRIGLKYNESWPDFAVKKGYEREHFRYDFFIATPQAIVESWRMGSEVPALQIEFPEDDKGYVKKPIKFDADKFQLLVAPPVSLRALFEGTGKPG